MLDAGYLILDENRALPALAIIAAAFQMDSFPLHCLLLDGACVRQKLNQDSAIWIGRTAAFVRRWTCRFYPRYSISRWKQHPKGTLRSLTPLEVKRMRSLHLYQQELLTGLTQQKDLSTIV